MTFWLKMRVSNIDVPASHLLIKGQPAESFTPYAPNLSDALEKYCRLKGIGRGDQFFTVARRNIGYVIEHLGDRPLDAYSSSDASSVRDWLFQRNLSSTSIQRIFSTIRAAINITIQEDGLSCANAFARTPLGRPVANCQELIKSFINSVSVNCLSSNLLITSVIETIPNTLSPSMIGT